MSLIIKSNLLRIPFTDIEEATENFTTLIGRGGYGPVYKGQLSLSGQITIVAVKRLQTDNFSGQGCKEFLTEIQMLSRYKHQNLASLVGFCEECNENFLIYEYAEHGSLYNYLKPSRTRCLLTWKQRISICIDAARGLDHLHNHVAPNQRVIHRDIKSANILLDHNWKAMTADFGLSKIGRANESITYLITDPCGTYGYCDPAYIESGVLTKECDIYSFGVVLLEVLCGRLCYINTADSREQLLVPLAKRYYKEVKLNLIIDPELKNHLNSGSMKSFSEIALQCLHNDRVQRPLMDLVLQKLHKALQFLEIEEERELLELEEAMGLQTLVETLQMEHFEEAYELSELEAAPGSHELMETLNLEFEDEDKTEKLEEKTLWISNTQEYRLPSDYRQFIYYSNKQMMKKPQRRVIFPTKEEAYSILSRGVLVKLNGEVNMWFWITELNGKRCFVLPPTLIFYGEQPHKIKQIPSEESRIEHVLHLSPSEAVVMVFEVPIGILSTNTEYGCYLVYKTLRHFVGQTLVQTKLDDSVLSLGQSHNILTCLDTSEIGPYGVISRSPSPVNESKRKPLPVRRMDGWLEVNLGIMLDIQRTPFHQAELSGYFQSREKRCTWQSCFLQCMSDNNTFAYFSKISIHMCCVEEGIPTPKLILQASKRETETVMKTCGSCNSETTVSDNVKSTNVK